MSEPECDMHKLGWGWCPMHGEAPKPAKKPEASKGMKFIGAAIALWPEALIYEKDGTWYLVDGVKRHTITDDEGTF